MAGLLQGISTALSGILSQQSSLQTVAHNVANANTEGFSRQTAPLKATDPINLPGLSAQPGRGVLGTGVRAAVVTRNRDSFLDLQFREGSEQLGQFEAIRDTLRQVEAIFGEPSESSISSVAQNLFDALQDLSGFPEDTSARTAVIESARTFAFRIGRAYEGITTIQSDLNNRVVAGVNEINATATELATLNTQIARGSAGDSPANDLMDRRDVLLDDLSKLVGIKITSHANGEVDVRIEGMLIVARDKTFSLTTAVNVTTGFDDIVYSPFSTVLSPSNGTLAGLIDARDVKLGSVAASTGILSRLDTYTSNLIAETNALHRGQYGLEPSGAENITAISSVLGSTGSYTITSDGAGNLTATFTPTSGSASTAITGTITAGGTKNTLIPGVTLTAAAAFTGTTTTITVADGLVLSTGGDIASAVDISGSFSIVPDVGAGTVAITFTPVGGSASAAVTKTFTAGAANAGLITGLTLTFDVTADLTDGGADSITTGNNFFQGITAVTGIAARDIDTHSSFLTSLTVLAASSSYNEEGDGIGALNLSNIGIDTFTALGNTSFNEFHRATVSSLGADTRQNSTAADNQEDLLGLINATRQSTSGVSLDEETADLLRFQIAFQGSARVLTSIDELLDLIVNRLGIIGR